MAQSLSFRMMADWETSDKCRLLWPYRKDLWRRNAQPIKETFRNLALSIRNTGTKVTVYAKREHLDDAKSVLPLGMDIQCLSYNDIWVRDTGPTFVKNCLGEVRGVDWNFNAWGGVYGDFKDDNNLARNIMCRERMSRVDGTRLTTEGGAFVTDGEGTVITTESSILNPNRNPGLTKEKATELIKLILGAERVIWLKEGLCGDHDTDGHVDQLVAFAKPGHVFLAWTDNENEPQHYVSLDAEETLKENGLEVHRLHIPKSLEVQFNDVDGIEFNKHSIQRIPGTRIPVSYVNYYRGKYGIVMPCYGDYETDGKARETICKVLEDVNVTTVLSREIALGGGGIHCMTC